MIPDPTPRERPVPRVQPTLVPLVDQTFVGARPRRTGPAQDSVETIPPWADQLSPEEAAEWLEVMEERRPKARRPASAGPTPIGLLLAGLGGAAMAAPFALVVLSMAVAWAWLT